MRKYLFIVFIQLHVLFAHAGIFNSVTDRDRFIEEAVTALNKKYYKNVQLELTGNAAASDYVVDIRNLQHQQVHTLSGGDLTALNTVLSNFKATYKNDGVAIYVLLSTSQPHIMANASDGYTDNTYLDQYLRQVKNMSRDDWNSLPQPTFDQIYKDYKTELQKITNEIIDKSQLGIQTKKGALLHLFGNIDISKPSVTASTSVKFIYTPIIALGQDLKAASMQSMLTYINTKISSIQFFNPKKLYDPAQSTNGIINPYVDILIDAFTKLMSDSFVADENDLSLDAMLVYYRQGASNLNTVINKLNVFPSNQNPSTIVKKVNDITYTVKDYAGILTADPENFWNVFLKIADKNNGIGIKEINAEVEELNYYIIITSENNKKDGKVATQLILENPATDNVDNSILVAMHFRSSTAGDLPVQYSCRYSDKLKDRITSLRKENGYCWYQNTKTGETVLGKQLSFTSTSNGYPQATDWVCLGLNAYVNPFNSQKVYTRYVNNPVVDYMLSGVDRSFNALDAYMMENGEVVGEIILEAAIIGATGGGSLIWTGARIIACQGAKRITLEVTKGAVIAYTVNVGLNMIITDFEIGQPGYNEDVFSGGIDKIGVITAGLEEIYKDETSKALINCAGGITSASLKDKVRFLDLPEGCLRNVTTYYLTARLFGSGGAANIVVNKLKVAYNINPARFVSRLKSYFSFSDDQIKTLLNKLGISNVSVVDNLNRFVLAAGRKYTKEASLLISKSSTITNEVSGTTWKFYTSSAKNKVFAEINTNGDLVIKDFSTESFTGSSDDIIRSANYTNPSGQLETADIAFVTKPDGTTGITKKVISNAVDPLDNIILLMKNDFPKSWKFNKVGNDAYEVLDGTGTKWGTVYKDRIVAPGRTAIGTQGNPILNKVPLVKNMIYEVDGFIYQTDDLGRVIKTNADLDDVARVRLGNQQIRAVDIKDGVRGTDQGGHIIASRFFGPGEQINLYAQSSNLNQGAWKQMEGIWADAMVMGSDVRIEINAVFSGTSQRPIKFEVEYWIDNEYYFKEFNN